MIKFKGTYGNVYLSEDGRYVKKVVHKYHYYKLNGDEDKKDSNKNEDKVDDDNEGNKKKVTRIKYFESTSIKEIVSILSLSSIKNIIPLIDVRCGTNDFTIKMPYRGKPLDKWCRDLRFVDRLQKIPTIMGQLISIVNNLSILDIVHGDIKPQNILIDRNDRVTLIDFGACILDTTIISEVKDPIIFNMCTYWFSSPEMLSLKYKKNKISPKHDIFSLGLILKYILINGYTKDEDTFIVESEKRGDERYSLNLDLQSTDINNLLFDMLIVDQDSRPSASELLSRSIFDRVNKETTCIDIFDSRLKNIRKTSFRTEMVNYIFSTCEMNDYQYMACLSVWIMDKYSTIRQDLSYYEYNILGISCILIADCLLQYGRISLNSIKHMISPYSIITNTVCIVLHDLDYKVYARTFDYYLRKSEDKVDYDIVKQIVLDVDNMSLSIDEQLAMYRLKADEATDKMKSLKI